MNDTGRPARLSSPVSHQEHIRGMCSANVILVLYAEYPCPKSAQVYQWLQELQSQFEAQLCWVFRHFLSAIEPESASHHAAEAVEAAANQGQFWEMSDYLMTLCLNEPQHPFDDASLVEAAITLNVGNILKDGNDNAKDDDKSCERPHPRGDLNRSP